MKRILFIDDDVLLTRMYQNIFEAAGFAFSLAHDGESGLKLFEAESPDLVVLDLFMPKMPGLMVLKRIRESESAAKDVPVVVLSNGYLTRMLDAAREAGASECLVKSETEPEDLVKMALRKLGLADEAKAPVPSFGSGSAAAVKRIPQHTSEDFSTIWKAKRGPVDAKIIGCVAKGDALQTFLEEAPAIVTKLKNLLSAFARASDAGTPLAPLNEMIEAIRPVVGKAAAAGFWRMSDMASAVKALLREVLEDPEEINPSIIRTTGQAIELLSELVAHATPNSTSSKKSPVVLVVDDDAVCRRTVSSALELATLRAVTAGSPNLALTLLEENSFDLVFLDVDMPSKSGLEVCSILRMMPNHRTTPVVFATGLKGTETRIQAIKSGGNDFVAKPFFMAELPVKALTMIYKNQLRNELKK